MNYTTVVEKLPRRVGEGLDVASVAWSYSTSSAMDEDIEDMFVKPAQPQGSEGLTLGPALNN